MFLKHLPKDTLEQLIKLRAVNIQGGKIVAKPIRIFKISNPTIEGFAKSMAAQEQGYWGQGAQQKNPNSRQNSSTSKKNRDDGPS